MIAAFFVSTVGFGFFLYGKKQMRIPQLVTGLSMMLFPYLVSGEAATLGLGTVLVLSLWLSLRAGL